MAQDTPQAEGEYRIVVNSIQLIAGTPLSKPIVHNELAFYQGNKLIVAFNGDPLSRTTGQPVHMSTSNADTLRVTISDTATRGETMGRIYPQIYSGTVFQGGVKEFAEHLHQATNAAHSINNSNVDYVMASVIGTPQNSNSVVNSLLQAMDLPRPAGYSAIWAPGDGRSLLPNNFADLSRPLDPRDSRQIDNLTQRLNDLRPDAVQARVRQDPNPYAAGTRQDCERTAGQGIRCDHLQAAGQLFDPSKPAPHSPVAAPATFAASEPERVPERTPQRPATSALGSP